MSRPGARGPVVAIIDWRTAASLKDNAGVLRRAGLTLPGRRRGPRPAQERSLVVRADGSGELHRFTPATVGRRLRAGSAAATIWRTEKQRRG
ncbi:MAG TPA: hypothetical protein VI078_08515 [bacterium]